MRTTLPLSLALLLAAAAPVAAQTFANDVAVSDGTVFVAEPAATARPGTIHLYRAGADGAWALAGQLQAPDAHAGDGFATTIAVDDGLLLAAHPGDAEGRGAVYVFQRRGEEWTRAGRIVPDDALPGDSAGIALAVSGERAIIGSIRAGGAGAAWVFRREGGQWVQEARLTGSDAKRGDAFGAAVAISGGRAAVGAPLQGSRRGGAYVFAAGPSGWAEEAKLLARTVGQGDHLGASVAVRGDTVLVGAPTRDAGAGAVYVFAPSEAGQWGSSMRLLPFEGGTDTRFGTNLAFAGQELFTGTPGARGYGGAVHQLRQDPATGAWTHGLIFTSTDTERGDNLGGTFATDGRVAVAGLPGDDRGFGTAVIFTRDGAAWREAAKVASDPALYAGVRGGQVDCTGGRATAFECSEVDLVAFLPSKEIGAPRGIQLNDVWGWTDPQSGREYAIVGREDGTSFVDITNASDPRYLGDLPLHEGAHPSTWRDIKVYANHAYVVADGAGPHGVQVFDLTQLRDVRGEPVTFEETAHYDQVASAHNIVIDTLSGFAFSVGGSSGGETCGGGLHMIDIREPASPRFAGCFADPLTGEAGTGYSHDAQCVTYEGPDADYAGRQICLGANETALSIADVTDKSAPVAVARATYPNVGYSHQGWLTEDHRYFYMDDELDELQGKVAKTRTLIWDVSDLDDPQLVGEYLGSTEASDHNLYIRGDRMYQSNYVSGLRILDITDRTSPREIGYFDTVPHGDNSPGFDGSWSNYPFFESGVIIVTSDREGLFLLKERKPIS